MSSKGKKMPIVSDSNMFEENIMPNTAEASSRCLFAAPTLEISDQFTFLEDIDPPSFLESSYDSCYMQSSTPNSAGNKIQQEQLVSLNSTDDQFRSHLLSSSMDYSHLPKAALKDITNGSYSSCASHSNHQTNLDDDVQPFNKTKSSDLSSFTLEAEVLKVVNKLEQAVSSNVADEQGSFLALDQISDSILVSSVSGEDSVFVPDASIKESPAKEKALMGESFTISCGSIETVPSESTASEPEKESQLEQNTTVVVVRDGTRPELEQEVKVELDDAVAIVCNDARPEPEKESQTDRNATVVIDTNDDRTEPEKAPKLGHNTTVIIASDDAKSEHGKEFKAEQLLTVAQRKNMSDHSQNAKSPMNITFEKMPDRLQIINRTFDKCTPKRTAKDTTIAVAEAVGLNVADMEDSIATTDPEVEECTAQDDSVEDLKNGMFLMGGKETNLMDMEASDLMCVLLQTNSSGIADSKRRSLQIKDRGTPSSNRTRRSLMAKDSASKQRVSVQENKLLKKLDSNPFSSINLFKSKLRGPGLRAAEKKGPMKATFVPGQGRFDESPTAVCRPRAVSSPCTAGVKLQKGSRSDSEYSGPPMPSFGSVSTIDSDRPSTPDLGTGETPEVFRRKNSGKMMMTSTPSLHADGKVSVLRMADFPTPIMAPSSKPLLRNITETLIKSGCLDDNIPNTESGKSLAKSPEDKTIVPPVSNSHHHEATVVTNSRVDHNSLLNVTKDKESLPAAPIADLPIKTEKEVPNPSKVVRTSISGLPLKGRALNTGRISTARPAPSGVGRPVTNKCGSVANNPTSIAGSSRRPVAKTGIRPPKKSLVPKTEPAVSKLAARRVSALPVNPKSTTTTQGRSVPPSRTVPAPRPARSTFQKPTNAANVKKAAGGNSSINGSRPEPAKRSSVIPRPTFKA